jgi:hypothetical protein
MDQCVTYTARMQLNIMRLETGSALQETSYTTLEQNRLPMQLHNIFEYQHSVNHSVQEALNHIEVELDIGPSSPIIFVQAMSSSQIGLSSCISPLEVLLDSLQKGKYNFSSKLFISHNQICCNKQELDQP